MSLYNKLTSPDSSSRSWLFKSTYRKAVIWT